MNIALPEVFVGLQQLSPPSTMNGEALEFIIEKKHTGILKTTQSSYAVKGGLCHLATTPGLHSINLPGIMWQEFEKLMLVA